VRGSITRKVTIAFAVILTAIVVGLVIAYVSVHGLHARYENYGRGVVTSIEHEPAKFRCVSYNSRHQCTKTKMVKAEDFEIDYVDYSTGVHREAHVNRSTYMTCSAGMFFEGYRCR